MDGRPPAPVIVQARRASIPILEGKELPTGTILAEVSQKDSDIPDELLEFPPPDTLLVIDEQLSAVLEEVKVLLESRENELQVPTEGTARMPIQPPLKYIFSN